MADMLMVGCVRPGSTCDSRQKLSCSVSATACLLACGHGAGQSGRKWLLQEGSLAFQVYLLVLC